MELGTLGSILKYALKLETSLITFSKGVLSNSDEPKTSETFQELIIKHEKILKRLKRVRHENTTEMILEPIKNFNSNDYSLNELEQQVYSEENIVQTMKNIETVIRDFYFIAAEKVSFIAEVSSFLENLAEKHQENLVTFNQPL
ncbi:MAG: hypothetical protein H7645_01385 [Candidatus Heimdallarchaeota archaeon]|nr:hypothetical protein [Candidatus Heimdallarchaeota archaeon]MCK4768968.1 hypothetical protein [Candidatus Heimdallarchaeota archaeon]